MSKSDRATPSRLTILSGGQTGTDRAALDAALQTGTPCGGYCPRGRRAEDGVIAERYPLIELPSRSYRARTKKNVEESDGTLVVSFGEPDGGTAYTIYCAERAGKPLLVIDAAVTTIDEAVRRLAEFVGGHGIGRLNIAGPRASNQPGIYDYTHKLLIAYLS